MQRLGKNFGAYHGETIDIRAIQREVVLDATRHGWKVESYFKAGDFDLLGLHLAAVSPRMTVYISAGIHGDEPAGPLALRTLIAQNNWPPDVEFWICPCLNPASFMINRREHISGVDLNRDYLHLQTEEVRAHIEWLKRCPRFDMALCLHEDWESHGFYLYELNPKAQPSRADAVIEAVSKVCPIDLSEIIETRPAHGGIVRPSLDPASRPQWPEAFYLIQNKTMLCYTLEAPSDWPLPVRENALATAVRSALAFQSK